MDKAIIKMQPVILNFICIFLIPKFCVLCCYVSKAKVKIWNQDRKEKKLSTNRNFVICIQMTEIRGKGSDHC